MIKVSAGSTKELRYFFSLKICEEYRKLHCDGGKCKDCFLNEFQQEIDGNLKEEDESKFDIIYKN